MEDDVLGRDDDVGAHSTNAAQTGHPVERPLAPSRTGVARLQEHRAAGCVEHAVGFPEAEEHVGGSAAATLPRLPGVARHEDAAAVAGDENVPAPVAPRRVELRWHRARSGYLRAVVRGALAIGIDRGGEVTVGRPVGDTVMDEGAI